MGITIIYVACSANKSGDYTAAGEIAFALQQKFTRTDNRCVLASSVKGVRKFTQLYGTSTPNELKIHDVTMKVTTLKELASSQKKEEIRNYIEVARCQPPSPDLVREAITPTTQLLFISLANDTDAEATPFHKIRYAEEFHRGKANAVLLGFGSSRIGVTVYDGEFAPIDHSAFRNMATRPYAFVYFNESTEKASAFVKDFLKTYHASTKYQPNHYIIVGDGEKAKAAIESFFLFSKKPAKIFDTASSKLINISRSEAKRETSCVSRSLSEIDQPSEVMWNFLLLPNVPNQQMRSLMKFSQPLIGITSIGSMLEALFFWKSSLLPISH